MVEDFLTDKELVETLFHDSTVALKIDLDEDITSVMYASSYVKEHYADVLPNTHTYSEAISVFIERQVIPEERPIISAVTNIQNIREALRNKNAFSVIYRNTYNNTMMYSILKYLKAGSDPNPKKFYCFFRIVMMLFKNS